MLKGEPLSSDKILSTVQRTGTNPGISLEWDANPLGAPAYNFENFSEKLHEIRDVVSTGPLARGHLIWPPGHLLLDSTGPDWPPKFKN